MAKRDETNQVTSEAIPSQNHDSYAAFCKALNKNDFELAKQLKPVGDLSSMKFAGLLYMAAKKNELKKIEFLLEEGLKPNKQFLDTLADDDNTALLEALKANGTDLNKPIYNEKTLLDIAIENKAWEQVKFLLTNGAVLDGQNAPVVMTKALYDVELANILKEVPGFSFDEAFHQGDFDLAAQMLKIDSNINGTKLASLLDDAIKDNRLDKIKFLFTKCTINGDNTALLKAFLAKGADINAPIYGRTLIDIAVKNGAWDQVTFLLENDAIFDIEEHRVAISIESGSIPTLYNAFRRALSIYTAPDSEFGKPFYEGNFELAGQILKNNPELNGRSTSLALLYRAVEENRPDRIEFLVKNGGFGSYKILEVAWGTANLDSTSLVSELVKIRTETNKPLYKEMLLNIAIYSSAVKQVKFLLENGAKIELLGSTKDFQDIPAEKFVKIFQTLKPSDIKEFMTLSASNENIVPAVEQLCLKVAPTPETTTIHTLALFHHPLIKVAMPEGLSSHLTNAINFFKNFAVCKNIATSDFLMRDVADLIVGYLNLSSFKIVKKEEAEGATPALDFFLEQEANLQGDVLDPDQSL